MISRKVLGVVLTLSIAPIALPALAAKGFSYSFAEAGYQYTSGDPENFQHLIEHFTMLSGHTDLGFDRWPAFQLLDDRRHFYGLWTGAEDCEYFECVHVRPLKTVYFSCC